MLAMGKLAENIRSFRLAQGLSQGELAEMLHISPQSVSKWERGGSVPDIDNLCALSEIFQVSLDVLLNREKEGKKVLVGVDGGGTKTEFVLFDEDGDILKTLILGACNPNAIGIEKTVELLKEGIGELLKISSDICGVFVGGSGFLTGGNGEVIRGQLQTLYPGIRFACKTDVMNVIGTCKDVENCIAVICGTGSAVFAKEKDSLVVRTGWNYLLSKQGSGFDIGRDAIYFALEEQEGRGEKTLITKLMEEKTGIQVSKLIAEVYQKDATYIASFAEVVFRAYEQGDQVAESIISENANRVAEVINQTAKEFPGCKTVILSGGLNQNCPAYLERLTRNLDKNLSWVVPREPQVIGACRLCARMCEVSDENLGEDFVKNYMERR